MLPKTSVRGLNKVVTIKYDNPMKIWETGFHGKQSEVFYAAFHVLKVVNRSKCYTDA